MEILSNKEKNGKEVCKNGYYIFDIKNKKF